MADWHDKQRRRGRHYLLRCAVRVATVGLEFSLSLRSDRTSRFYPHLYVLIVIVHISHKYSYLALDELDG